jgi:hypothetical protein
LRGKAGNALMARAKSREPIHAAPAPQVAAMMKSRRFMAALLLNETLLIT